MATGDVRAPEPAVQYVGAQMRGSEYVELLQDLLNHVLRQYSKNKMYITIILPEDDPIKT